MDHIKKIDIKGFRGFENLSVDDFAQINVIVGKNNVGKTALLEALLLLGQPCYVANSLDLNVVRMLTKTGFDTLESWDLLFHKKVTSQPLKIEAIDGDDNCRELTITLGQASELHPDRERAALLSKSNGLLQQQAVRFEYSDSEGERSWALAAVVGGEMVVIDTTALAPPFALYFASTWRMYSDVPLTFSKIAQQQRESEFVNILRTVFPEITHIQSLSRGKEPTLFASIGNGPPLPIQTLGDGSTRLISWLLTIMNFSDRVLLIDEIDSGIHHSILVDAFRCLMATAKKYNVQLFATTHSYEALKSLSEAHISLGDEAPSLRVIRLQRVKEEIRVIRYTESVLEAAVTDDLEVR